MPDVIINFKAVATGQEDVISGLVEQGKAEAAVVAGVQKANSAFQEQQKIVNQDATAFDKLAKSMAGVPKSIATNSLKELEALQKSVKAADLSVDAFATSAAIARKELEALPKGTEAYKKLEAEIKASIVINENLNKTFSSTRAELRAMRETIFQLEEAGLDGTKVFDNLAIEAGKLSDAAGDVQARIKTLSSDTFKFDVALQATSALTAGFSVAQGAAALLGDESEDLQRTLLKVNAAIAILNGLQQIQALTQKETALSIATSVALQKISVLQTNLQSAAESRFIVVRYAAVAAQTVLNAVMAANPAGVILFAIAALATAVVALTRSTESAAEAQQKLNQGLEISINLANEYAQAVAQAGDVIVAQLEAEGAAQAEIRKARINNLREQLNIQEQAEARAKANYAAANKNLEDAAKKGRDIEKEDREARVEAYDLANDAVKAAAETRRQIEIAELNNIRDTNKEKAEAEKERAEDIKRASEQAIKARQDALRDQVAAAQAEVLNARDTRVKLVAEMVLANAEMRLALADPNIGPGARLLAETQQGEAIRKARAEFFGELETVEVAGTERIKNINDKAFQERLAQNQRRLESEQETAQASIAIAEEEAAKKAEISRRLQELQINTALTLATAVTEIARNQAEREIQQLQQRLDQGLISQEQFEQKSNAIKRRSAQQEKQLALFQATIAQSLAVLSILKDQTIPTATKPVFIALAVAQAIAQIAAIASRPIPAFKKGTKNAPGGLSLIGEAGAELYYNKGEWKYAGGAQIVNLDRGDKVIPAMETRQIMAAYSVPTPSLPKQIQQSEYGGVVIDYDKLGAVIGREVGRLPIHYNKWDQDGYSSYQGRVSNFRSHQNNRYRIR